MSAFVVSGIAPSLKVDAAQRFILGWEELPEPLGKFSLDNIYTPIIGSPSVTQLGLRNEALSGYRWIHETSSTETYGKFKLQKFLNASPTGIDIMIFNDDGSFSIPGTTDSKFIIQTVDPELPNAQSLGALTTGLLKNTVTTGTGVLSTAIAGTDYYSPGNPVKLIANGSSFNFGMGTNIFNAITDGILNVIFSRVGGAQLTSGFNNIILSAGTADNITTGNRNILIGNDAGISFVIGSENVVMGDAAGLQMTGTRNVVIGSESAVNCGSGDNSVFIGYRAGFYSSFPASYVNCIFIGKDSGSIVDTLNNAIAIGFGASVSTSNSMVLGESVNVGVGTSSPTQSKFVVFGGVQNVASEDSIIRVISSSNSAKIELQNTTVSTGKLYELRSNSGGTFSIFDRTIGHERFIFNNDGSITCNGPSSGGAQFIVNNNDATSSTTGFVFKNAGNTRATFYHSEVTNELSLIGIFGGMPLIFGTNGLEKMRLNSTGNLGIGTNNPTLARLQVEGGITNVASEESVARFISGLNAAKIEIQCTNGSGKLYELRSNNAGAFGIFDRTGSASRLSIDTNGISTFTNNVLISTASASDVPLYQVGHNTDIVQLGYDGPNDYSYINIAGSSNDRLAFRVGGTGVAALLQSGLFGLGTITPTVGKLQVNGGVQNIANEESAIRVIGALNHINIELQNTAGSGKLFEIRSSNAGVFDVTDRTGGATRFTITSAGNIGIGTTSPNAILQLSNATASRKLIIFESANNDHQVKGFGHTSNEFRFQTNTTTDSYVFYAGTTSSTSDEVGRISGVGTFTISKILGKTANQPGVAAGSAAGSSPTLTIAGSELSGTFEVVAGTTPSGTTIATFTLDVAMANSSYGVVITPANQTTAALATSSWINVTSTTQFTISCATPLVATSTYKWNYHIIGC